MSRTCSDCDAPISDYSRGRCKPCSGVARLRPVPVDFRVQLGLLGSKGCGLHYKASLSTVTRWRRILGIRLQYRARKSSFPSGGRTGRLGSGPRAILCNRDMSAAGQAADFLRKYGAVYRCTEAGKPNPKGGHWNRNGHVLTDEDIIFRASRLGFVRPGSMA